MHVIPGCLNPGTLPTEYFEGAGYGQDQDGLQTNKLLKVQLKFVESSTCQESYELKISPTTQICANNYRDDVEPMDLCYADSGSALQFMNTDLKEGEIFYKIPTLVAITSFGIGCAFGFPSVYVNVTNYIDWMESVISP
jgi:secreted trypsin-like serine protease